MGLRFYKCNLAPDKNTLENKWKLFLNDIKVGFFFFEKEVGTNYEQPNQVARSFNQSCRKAVNIFFFLNKRQCISWQDLAPADVGRPRPKLFLLKKPHKSSTVNPSHPEYPAANPMFW